MHSHGGAGRQRREASPRSHTDFGASRRRAPDPTEEQSRSRTAGSRTTSRTPGLTDQVALVTGAASGIGAAVVEALRDNGSRVAACDIDPAVTETTDGYRLDVTDDTAVADTVATVERDLGPIGILVNVAGILRPARLLDTDLRDWNEMLAVNAGGVLHTTRHVANRMVRRGRGAIVTVASNAATVPRQRIGGYAASKAAAAQLTRCFGLELAESGIRCNIVAPGSCDTPMLHTLSDGTPGSAVTAAVTGDPGGFRLGIPLGKVARPMDVAAAVCFLASDAAAHLTLQELYVDGGASLK